MKKILTAIALSLFMLSSPTIAGKDFDVESMQAGKAYFWSSYDSEDEAGIINSTTKTRNIRIHVYDNSPAAITFSFPCENDQTELKQGQTIVCPLKPFYKGSGKGYIISWATKNQKEKALKATGDITLQFN
jgi:hypothetical protein